MVYRPHDSARSLYQRWRSKSFSEIVAQEHVTRTLRNAVASGRVAHAYLFCGPRGTGKTSTARVLAKAVNCLDLRHGEPCNRCASCRAVNEGRAIDLIEIDAASNRGIDDARELREKIRFSPAELRYKVYIIDEAHMLTSEASNALLKTLEEPPEHAILILATTESHKILPTIASRCQRFDFRRIPSQAIVERLRLICSAEQLTVEDGVLERIARMSGGSLRDAESLLDQIVAYCGDQIDLPSAADVLGLAGEDTVHQFAEALRLGDLAGGLRLIDGISTSGVDLRQFAREVVDYLRAMLVAKSGAETTLTAEFRPERLATIKASAEQWEYGRLLASIRVLADLEGKTRLEPFDQLRLEMAFAEVALGGAASEGAREERLAAADEPRLAFAAGEAGRVPVEPASHPKVVAAAARHGAETADGSNEPSVLEKGATAEEGAGHEHPLRAGSPESDKMNEEPRPEAEVPKLGLAELRALWPRILEELGPSGAAYRGCQPLRVSGNVITFAVEKAGLRNMIERPVLLGAVKDRIGKLFGTPVSVKFAYGVRIDNVIAPPERDAVVEAAVRELGFRVSRVEVVSD